MPYPDGNLKTRAITKPGIYSLIPPEERLPGCMPEQSREMPGLTAG